MKLEHHYLTILESLHDPIIIISKDYTIVYVNKAYEAQFNVPEAKVVGRNLIEIEPNSRILDVAKDGAKRINDFSYVESLQKHVYANIMPLREEGELIGVVTIMKDISETKHLQEELAKYKKMSIELQEQLEDKTFWKLKTDSPAMKKSVDLAKEIAPTDATVVLYGESGVGKEVFAQAIHESSNRHNKPFVAINMASIPDSLFESELFGYEDGSFTGSRRGGKAGLLEAANGGTILLDEIGELSLNNQTKLLRVIQERQFMRVGSTKLTTIDLRIICATNRNLMEEVKAGRFREDLFYRINVLPITIPPLRQRKEDLAYLATIILNDIAPRYHKHLTLEKEALEKMKAYKWPGNVRELYNVLERVVALSSPPYITVDDLPDFVVAEELGEPYEEQATYIEDSDVNLKEAIEKVERDLIQYAVKTSNNKTDAIRKLGISRKTFYKKTKKYNII
ncbi:MAG TPA: sigma 54-interacting transcriptional regulator [Pseudogracilibacillus sp.]|nr:sigma 54-interacting transcriptional regulator [Pseudogracilibacillus sp.]